MAFWKQRTEPLRKYRFMFLMETDDRNFQSKKKWWWCKSVALPEVTVEPAEFQLSNTKIKIPTISTYGDLSVKFIAEAADRNSPSLKKLLQLAGVSVTVGPSANDGPFTLLKYGDPDKINPTRFGPRVPLIDPTIQLLNSKGTIVEMFSFAGAFIKSVSFSDLDYSSDDIMEFDIVISVDSMIIR